MKALMSVAPGGPDTLQLLDVPVPEPGPGEVRLAVSACAINYPDTLVIEDKYQFRPPRPFAPGHEVAGVVEALGPGVTAPAVGTRVIASVQYGGLAERLIARAAHCVPMPDAMPFDVGASLLVTYGTSYHALADRARLRAGEPLLVLGAAGGVGIAAIELGKAMGARVVAAVSTQAKAEVARAHGADATIVYPATVTDGKALAALFKDACGKQGADVIYDPVGGDYAEPALRAIAWGGRYLVIGFPAGIPRIPLNLALLKGCDICGVFWGSFAEREPDKHRAQIAELMRMCLDGRIRPEVSARFPLAQGGEALKTLSGRAAVGKVIVTMG
ncbi:MAG: NADPH:quinone oxidoreductase family protein [Gammaproteobacteria bacterium]